MIPTMCSGGEEDGLTACSGGEEDGLTAEEDGLTATLAVDGGEY